LTAPPPALWLNAGGAGVDPALNEKPPDGAGVDPASLALALAPKANPGVAGAGVAGTGVAPPPPKEKLGAGVVGAVEAPGVALPLPPKLKAGVVGAGPGGAGVSVAAGGTKEGAVLEVPLLAAGVTGAEGTVKPAEDEVVPLGPVVAGVVSVG